MDRHSCHKLFKTVGPAVLPVVHVLDYEQTQRNVRLALDEGAQGIFLINHNFSHSKLLPILRRVRAEFPSLWLGANFLGITGLEAFPVLGQLERDGVLVDAYWADDACVDERLPPDQQRVAEAIQRTKEESGWNGLYFGGTAFKGQRPVANEDVGRAASIATQFMDVVTTSGTATGVPAALGKLKRMRTECEGVAMALASGVTPSNAGEYAPIVDCFLVATGISPKGDFYNFDCLKLRALLQASKGAVITAARSDAWYLALMAPNTQGDKFAWLDPSSIYMNATALADLTSDLLSQFSTKDYDLIVGIDAMGFPLAAAMATRSGKGFLTVRKAGRLCVEVDLELYDCYSGSGKVMEMRKNAFQPGTRILVVDQWMETGGTMAGAIRLIEKQGGVVAGIATIACERNPQTDRLASQYRLAHVVSPVLQPFIDSHTFLGDKMNQYLKK